MPLMPLLLLAGCGTAEPERRFTPLGGPDAEATGKPGSGRAAGTEAGGGDEARPAEPSPTAALAGDFEVVFEPSAADGNPVTEKFKEFWRAWWRGVATGGRDDGYRAYLHRDAVLRGGMTFSNTVKEWQEDGGYRPIGVARLHRLKVERSKYAYQSTVYVVTVCVDHREMGWEKLTTGQRKLFGNKPDNQYKATASWTNRDGKWLLFSYRTAEVTEAEGRECR